MIEADEGQPEPVAVVLERSDFVALNRVVKRPVRMFLVKIAVILIALSMFPLLVFGRGTLADKLLQIDWFLLAIYSGTIVFVWMLTPLNQFRVHRRLMQGHEELSYGLDETGIHAENVLQRNWISWDAVQKVTETSTHIFIEMAMHRAFIIPKRCFSSDEHRKAWLAFLDYRIYRSVSGRDL